MAIDLRHYLPALAAGGTKTPARDAAAELRQAKAQAETAAQLRKGVSLLESGLSSGGLAAFAKARQVLGTDGAFGPVLDELQAVAQAQEEGRLLREARTSAFAALKQVAQLPLPLPEKAALGRSVVARALAGGALAAEEQSAVEASLLSESVLQETRQALAGTAEPGAAKALVEESKQQGLLVPHDEALLERLAAERAPIEVQRQRARLAWKEQDDLAAYARGELPEPLSETSFTTIHGAQGAPKAWTRYQAARQEAEALAAIRGKSAPEIDSVRTAWLGNASAFEVALTKDAVARRRDPVDYLLANAVGLRQALDEIESPAERNALLWSAQSELGLGEGERSPWTLAEEARLADAWDALPAGYGGRNEKLGFLEKHLLSLPAGQRPAAIARLVRQGIVDGTEAELSQIVADIEAGRINVARRRAASLGARSTVPIGPRAAPRLEPREKSQSEQGDRGSTSRLTPVQLPLPPLPLPRPAPIFPGQPTPEETGRALERLWNFVSELLTVHPPLPSPSDPPSLDVLPPQKPEPQRDFDPEEVREIAEGLFGPGFEPVELLPIFTRDGFAIEDFGDQWIKEIFPDLSSDLPQITILESRVGSPPTRSLNVDLAKIVKEEIYKRTKIEPTSMQVWVGKRGVDSKQGELYLKNSETGGTRGASWVDISVEAAGAGSAKIHINTIDVLATGQPTGREHKAGLRILRNMRTGDVLILLPKPAVGETYNETAIRKLLAQVLEETHEPSREQDWQAKDWKESYYLIPRSP